VYPFLVELASEGLVLEFVTSVAVLGVFLGEATGALPVPFLLDP